MSLFYPTLCIDKITDIRFDILYKLNIKSALIDIDDTISPNSTISMSQEVLDWFEMLKSRSIGLIIISNNSYERVKYFAEKLHIPYVHCSMKPLPFGIYKAMKMISADKSTTVIIGDQIFTDVLAAKLSGIKSILVKPLSMEGNFQLRFKRQLESLIKGRWEN